MTAGSNCGNLTSPFGPKHQTNSHILYTKIYHTHILLYIFMHTYIYILWLEKDLAS